MRSGLYTGTLMHARRSPERNVFTYPIAFFVIDLDELPGLDRRLRLLSVNRPNVVAFRDRDHFDGGPVRDSVVRFCARGGIDVDGRIVMLTQLRVLGYVFNPVSFYWCHHADGSLACMVAELNNTFGERLPELLPGPGPAYRQRKRLHVSPFMGLDQEYEYAFGAPGDDVWARTHVREGDERVLTAVLHGRRRELTDRSLARVLVRHPLQPHQVTALIHWQALRLWRKGVPFHHKPPFRPGEGSIA